MIIEYKLDAGPRGMTVPAWVKDGGYFRDPDSFTMVGWTPDAPREFKVPDSVLILDKAGLAARLLDIHSRQAFVKEVDDSRVDMTEAEVTAMSDAWYDSKQGA